MSPPRTTLPRLDAYLAALPRGLASHPACLAKGALVRNAFEDVPAIASRAAELPPELGQLLREPPLGGEWVPEVHFVALFHAVNDLLGLDPAAATLRARERNRVLFESATYRILMAVFSPATLMRFAGKRWDNFHRGSTLEVAGAADDGVRVVLGYPMALFDAPVLEAFGQSFAAALELSGARNPETQIERMSGMECRYRMIWE